MKFIIVGCGRTGAGLAQTLSLRGHQTAIVDQNAEAFGRLGPAYTGQTLCGDGMDRDVLLRAGIERTDGIAVVTNSDEINVVTARAARQLFRVPRVVARVYDPRKAEIYRRLGLQTISTTTWGVNRAADLLTFSEWNVVTSLGNAQADIVEIEVPARLSGSTVSKLSVAGEISVVAISRVGVMLIPSPSTVFQSGDIAYVAVLAASAERFKTLMR
jgi:trk/ktr system potassium uptake protein